MYHSTVTWTCDTCGRQYARTSETPEWDPVGWLQLQRNIGGIEGCQDLGDYCCISCAVTALLHFEEQGFPAPEAEE